MEDPSERKPGSMLAKRLWAAETKALGWPSGESLRKGGHHFDRKMSVVFERLIFR